MTSISPSQEAREAAYELAVIVGRIPPDLYRDAFMSGKWDESGEVQAFAAFEAQIEARRTPPSDELRDRVARIIREKQIEVSAQKWSDEQVADEAADQIIALLPGGGGERARGFNDGLDHVANFINSLDSSEMTAKQVRSAIYSECLTAQPASSPTVSPDLVEVLRLATAFIEETHPAQVALIKRAKAALASAPAPIPTDLVERLRKLLEEAKRTAHHLSLPGDPSWTMYEDQKRRAAAALRNAAAEALPALLDAIEGKKS